MLHPVATKRYMFLSHVLYFFGVFFGTLLRWCFAQIVGGVSTQDGRISEGYGHPIGDLLNPKSTPAANAIFGCILVACGYPSGSLGHPFWLPFGFLLAPF